MQPRRRSTDASASTASAHVLSDGTAEISQLSGILSFKGKSATLAPADLRVGGAPARFGARVDDVFAPVVAFELSSAALPLCRGHGGRRRRRRCASSPRPGVSSLTKRTPELEADVRAAGGTIRGLAMTNLRARVAHAEGGTRVDPLSFDSCGGNLRGSLRRTAGQGASRSPRIELDVDAARLSIAELAAALTGTDGGAPATGVLTFELAAAGAGDDWPSLRTALDGRGRFDIADGALLGVNVPEAALERITGVPGLAALLPPRLRTDFPGLFGQKDTRFDSLAASFRIADGRLRTQDLAVKAPDFAIDADGTIGLDLGVDLAATLTTSPALSSRLVAEVDAVKLLTNREGIVTIPFRLAGTLPGVKPQPDLPALAARLQRGLVGALGEKLFGGEQKKNRRRRRPHRDRAARPPHRSHRRRSWSWRSPPSPSFSAQSPGSPRSARSPGARRTPRSAARHPPPLALFRLAWTSRARRCARFATSSSACCRRSSAARRRRAWRRSR